MSHRHHRARFLVAALTALLTGSFARATGLVLYVGTNGHRALELEHPGTECPTLASSRDTSAVSVHPSAKYLDLAATGTGPTALSSDDSERLERISGRSGSDKPRSDNSLGDLSLERP